MTDAGTPNGHAGERTFEDELESLGFRSHTRAASGTLVWVLEFNSYLTFTLHDHHDMVMFTWVFALGEFLETKGWVIGSGETSFHELYPGHDVRLPAEIGAVEAEITRTLHTLRLDLGDPGL